LNCPRDIVNNELSHYSPNNVLPEDTGGRTLSQVSLCESVALFSTNLLVNGVSKPFYAIDGFKSKVAAESNVAVTSILFAKTSSHYSVTPAQSAYIITAYQQFYPGEIPSAAVVNALSAVVTASSSTSTVTNDPAWTNLFLAICLSPGWQTL
jgi:hypothetical protein